MANGRTGDPPTLEVKLSTEQLGVLATERLVEANERKLFDEHRAAGARIGEHAAHALALSEQVTAWEGAAREEGAEEESVESPSGNHRFYDADAAPRFCVEPKSGTDVCAWMTELRLDSDPALRHRTAFPDPAMEAIFQRERCALGTSAPRTRQSLLLIGSLGLFLIAGAIEGAPLQIVVMLAAVLALHEAGHLVAMKVFEYRDVRVFFVPFLGAAVEGRRSNVAAWKQGVVLLMGPLPGIVLALLISWVMPDAQGDRLLRLGVLLLVFVNALNLLPLGGLDGARLLQRVLFSRHRHLEVIFLASAGVAMLVLAVVLHLRVLAAFAAFGLATIPRRQRVLEMAHALRQRGHVAEGDLATEDEAQLRPLFRAAYDALPGEQCLRERAIARFMEELVDAARPAPGWPATFALLTAWLGAVALSVGVGAMSIR